MSLNAEYKPKGDVENIVRSPNYIGKNGWKAIGGAVRELWKVGSCVVSSFETLSAYDEHESLYMNVRESADIHFINDLANGIVCVVFRLYGERYPKRRQSKYQSSIKCFRTWRNMDLSISIADTMIRETPRNFKQVLQPKSRWCRPCIHANGSNFKLISGML
ncbi:hypothetical protein TNCV_2041841 [Trichonephila clavipes]|nr:hypothetical protein TNCV_2041841 [Trichonephila clavipes]